MKPKIICLTPVRNEAWVLDRFIQAASLWADHIIISDQESTDGSREIARKYDKVILLENKALPYFDEYLMRKPLFDAAREIEGDKILISLDADELLTPNWDSKEWADITTAPEGTVVSFFWGNIAYGFKQYWCRSVIAGYVDDGAAYTTENIVHTPRSIYGSDHDMIETKEVGVIHLQYTDWERMQCKHRWYQCFEYIKKVNDIIDIFRRYHHMYSLPKTELKTVPSWWVAKYKQYGVDIIAVHKQEKLYWEKVVLDYMIEFGTAYFKMLNIWDVDWCSIARKWGYNNPKQFSNPQTIKEKLVLCYLRISQPFFLPESKGLKRIPYRVIKKVDSYLKKKFK